MIDISDNNNVRKIKKDMEKNLNRQLSNVELKELKDILELESEFVKNVTDISLEYSYEAHKKNIELQTEVNKLKNQLYIVKIFSLLDTFVTILLIILVYLMIKGVI